MYVVDLIFLVELVARLALCASVYYSHVGGVCSER